MESSCCIYGRAVIWLENVVTKKIEPATRRGNPDVQDRLRERAELMTDERLVELLMLAGDTREEAEAAVKNRL